ncbi:hypothetical protein BH20ACT9_BH20ACT9_00650 [soil metagenome]
MVLDRPSDLRDVSWQLLRIGYELPRGWLAGGMLAWRTAANAIATLPQITVHELHDRLGRDAVRLLDVRQPSEWAAGHIDTATLITGAELPQRNDEVPDDEPTAVTCGSGYRSSVAASLLASRGHTQVVNVLGGMAAWSNAGYPTAS